MRSEEYDDIVLESFLKDQEQLFVKPVAETIEEAEIFLTDCMAVVVDSEKEVFEYFEEEGIDVEDAGIDEISEVFRIPDGRYLIVEG